MSVVSCTYIQIYTALKIVRTNLRRCDQNGLAGSAYVVIHDIEKCSKEVGHFQRLPTTFKDLDQIPRLSRQKMRFQYSRTFQDVK